MGKDWVRTGKGLGEDWGRTGGGLGPGEGLGKD